MTPDRPPPDHDGHGNGPAPEPGAVTHLDIKMSYACNNCCIHCVIADQRDEAIRRKGRDWRGTAEMAREIQDAARRGIRVVTFTGGEPTLRKDLPELVRAARALGLRVGLQTNGRLLSIPAVRDRLAGLEVRFVVAVHGASAEVHDAVTRAPGSFLQTREAVRGLLEAGERVTLKTVISRRNLDDLSDIARDFADLGVRRFNWTFPHALGNARREFEAVVPRYRDAVPRVLEVLDLLERRGCEAVTEAIPLCLLGSRARQASEWHYRTHVRSEVHQLDQAPRDWSRDRTVEGKVHPPACSPCSWKGDCEGVWREYFEAFGDQELAAVPFDDPPGIR